MSVNESAPDAVQGAEGMDLKSGQSSVTSIVSDGAVPRDGWSVRVGSDLREEVYYDSNASRTALLRVHFRIARIPSRRRYQLQHLHGSTDADRAEALSYLPDLPATFDRLATAGHSQSFLPSDGVFWEGIWLGTPVEDPLIQLELEMMIDLSSGVLS